MANLALGKLLIVVACGCHAAGAPPRDRATARSPAAQEAAAVQVTRLCEIFDGNTRTVQAISSSGVVVGPEEVLTARHVVRCDKGRSIGFTVSLRGQRAMPANVVWMTPGRDLAKLRVPGLTWIRPVPYAPPALEAVCSEHAAPEWGRACGLVASIAPEPRPNGTLDINHTMPTVGGNSGSGIYNAAGELVGIVTNRHICETPPACGGLAASVYGHAP